MVAQDFHKRATYADLEAVPPNLVAEILFGRLVTHPRPAPRHSTAAFALSAILGPHFQFGKPGKDGWVFMIEPELHLGGDVAVPDLAGWKRERLSAPVTKAYIDVAPDWVCEFLSPSTEVYDRGDKRVIYANAGVQHLWHVDPRPQVLEVSENQNGKWLLTDVFKGEDDVRAPPFAELEFSLGLLWPLGPMPSYD